MQKDGGKPKAPWSQESLGLRQPIFETPKRLLRYDIWKTSTPPMDIPSVPPVRDPGKVLLSMSLPESADASLSRSFMEQCRVDDQLDGAGSRSSEASWISRWWSDAGNSNRTSLSTCKTDESPIEQVLAIDESNLFDEGPVSRKADFDQKKISYVSALSTMIGKDPHPTALCPPKHDIWSILATARKIQPTLGKLARCSGKGDRKVQSCPAPGLQPAMGDEGLSPSSASRPRPIPRPQNRGKNRCASPEGESMDTSYASVQSESVTDSSCNSSHPELVSREEHKRILLGRLMDYFFILLANDHKTCGRDETSSQTTSSSAELVVPVSGANSTTRRGTSGKGKRQAITDDEGSDDEESGGPTTKKAKTDETEVKRLACPFFKRNPHRYKDQGKCVGPGWITVHRLKEHIYRRHRLPIHCLRCHKVFLSDDGLEKHYQAQTPCQLRAGVKTLQGITSSQERQLRSRKRSDKTEEDKWRDVYRVCFPLRENEDPIPIPSPYFELPTVAESGGPGDSAAMDRYDEFMSRELPRRVKKALELRIEQEFSPVEETLRRQLPDIVRSLYQTLSEDFRKSIQVIPTCREEMGEHQGLDSETSADGGDIIGKGKMVAPVTPQPLTEAPGDALSECLIDESLGFTNGAPSELIDMYKLQPYLGASLTGLDSWMCGSGQESNREWGCWPDSGYLAGAMSAASSALMGEHEGNMFGNDMLAMHAPYTGENATYPDHSSFT
ncbi:hypothetical protein VPNG_03638 [Cytospora leucostoma]|uniref:C2H2-type domain-containing protein n=1 Tax=Cytospora leucostoma TaxID=1230097 RepID=A0A423XCV4_9PEZI|nr:hypothetical protein VPNG_03638 [Cytospora leucostoma]